jgi:hypothetical protein
MPMKAICRDEEAPIDRLAVRHDCVDLGCNVRSSAQSLSRTPIRVAPNDHGLSIERCPLALNAYESWMEVEDQVIALAVRQRLVDPDPTLGGLVRDSELGYSAFLIGCEHDLKTSLRVGQRYAVAASSSTDGTSLHRSSRR